MAGRSRDSVVESGHGTEATATMRAADTASDVLGGHLRARAAEFLRGLRLHAESAGSAEGAARAAEAVDLLRAAARRMNGALHTYRPLLDPSWADQLRAELSWLSGTLAREYAYAGQLERLLGALHRLAGGAPSAGPAEGGSPAGPGGSACPAGSVRAAGTTGPADPAGTASATGTASGDGPGERGPGPGPLPVGAARAGALLDRRLTLSRTRAHSAALQALGSARFHAVADAVAVLASEVPFRTDAKALGDQPADAVLPTLADQARAHLSEAVGALPLARAGAPYNAEALTRSLATEARQDAAWHQVRVTLRLHRYAQEVLGRPADADARLLPAGAALERHRDAAEAAAAAASAAGTPRIAPATAYALGVLHADQRHEVEAARFVFGRLWGQAPPPPVRSPRGEGRAS